MTETHRQQSAERGRWQSRQYGQRVDEAFIEHSEDNVDNDERSGDQQGFVRKRSLERLRIARESTDDGAGHVNLPYGLVDRIDGFAEGNTRSKGERYGDGRELSLMRDGERPNFGRIDAHERGKRHRGASQWRLHIETVEG